MDLKALRQLLGISPIDFGQCPQWVYRRLCRAVKDGRLHCGDRQDRGLMVHSAWRGYEASLQCWGSLRAEDGARLFALEPLQLDFAAYDSFRHHLGWDDCSFEILPKSWVEPGLRFRVVFRELVPLPTRTQSAIFDFVERARSGEFDSNEIMGFLHKCSREDETEGLRYELREIAAERREIEVAGGKKFRRRPGLMGQQTAGDLLRPF